MNTCLSCKIKFNPLRGAGGKYCSVACSHKLKVCYLGLTTKEYYENPTKCKECDTFLSRSQHLSKVQFCSSECGYLGRKNGITEESILKSVKSRKIYYAENPLIMYFQPHRNSCKITYCVVCSKVIHDRCNVKTCSSNCRSANNARKRIESVDSFGNTIFLDSSWELEMANDLNANAVLWSRPAFFKLSDGKRYTPDFYLSDYNLYLDPKCIERNTPSFVAKQTLQLEKIKQFEIEYNVQCLVITDQKLLTWEYVKSQIKSGITKNLEETPGCTTINPLLEEDLVMHALHRPIPETPHKPGTPLPVTCPDTRSVEFLIRVIPR